MQTITYRSVFAQLMLKAKKDASMLLSFEHNKAVRMSIEPQIPGKWTTAEAWVWGEIRAGRIADFHKYYDKILDPKKPDDWDDKVKDRRLSSAFLVTILTEERFRCVTPSKGVRITGACFEESIHLQHARLKRQLRLKSCRFHNSLKLVNLHVNGWLSLQGSWFESAVKLVTAKIDGQVILSNSTFNGKLALDGAKIGGKLRMNGSTFNDVLTMNTTEVGLGLFMRDASTLTDVDMSNAKIGGQVSMIGSMFAGELKMSGTEVNESLFMQMATFKDVDVSSAMIGAHLFMYGSTIESNLGLSGARISGDLDMQYSNFSGDVVINNVAIGHSFLACGAEFPAQRMIAFHQACIGSSFDLSGASIGAIDLTGTTIAGEFRLGSAKDDVPTKWKEKSILVLRNTSVGSIQDAHETLNCWPRELELDGFTYQYIGGLEVDETAGFGKRKSSWLVKWLALDPTFSPQPYEQLARVLRESGYSTKATDVLYAGRKRARQQAAKGHDWFHWIGMWFLQLTIGYGLGRRYFRLTFWVLIFTTIGAIVLLNSNDQFQMKIGAIDLAWASFDQLLPIISLNDAHERLTKMSSLPGYAIYYFYFHKLMGWLLGATLVAGLAGLTQKD